MRTTTTTGKDDNNCKDNDSKDDGNNGKNNSNDGGNGDSGGGDISASSGQGNAWLVAVLCSVLVVWRLHTVLIIQICFGILYSGLNWSKTLLGMSEHAH